MPAHFLVGDTAYSANNAPAVMHGKRVLVIDPEDPAQIERLFSALHARVGMATLSAALTSMLKSPKPAEPTGLGAVVEDADGRLWVLADPKNEPSWTLANESDTTWEKFRDIDAVRVRSEGVTA